jgi:magnesium transporter
VVIPIQFVLFTLSAIIGSAILYGDFQKATFHEIITFFYGCTATFAGVFIIAWAPHQSESDPEYANESGDDIPNAIDQQTPPEGSRHGLARQKRIIPAEVANLKDTRNRSLSIIGISPAQVSI